MLILELSWEGNSQWYNIYRNDTLIAYVNQNYYLDSNIIENDSYCYKINAINGYCESDFSDTVCIKYVWIDNIIRDDLSVALYPNPTSNKTILIVEGLRENTNVFVYNLDGRLINTYLLEKDKKELMIDVKDYSRGVYSIKISNSYSNILKKLIVY